jgi:hypothetical protein
MSGLLEMIARRRRASASRRLGPASQNGLHTFESNGAATVAPPAEPEPELEPEPVAPEVVEAVPEPEPVLVTPAPEREPEPEQEQEPVQPTIPPGFIERGRMRRRARYLRQLRGIQLRDIGGFLFETGRLDRPRPELLGEKLAAADETHRELHALERALATRQPVSELRAAGIGGECEHCGEIFGSSDRFCSSCGEPV